ncbi:MAG TPA: hypothetical protein VIK74_04010, partial [Parasegetibacter sp.]
FIVRTLELGANAYLTADAEAGEIYHALFSCFKPGIYLSTRARQYLTRTFDFLSANEIKIIKSLSRDINSVIMAKEIGFSPEIIEEIIEKLKKMAQVSTSEELVELARKMGFIERKEVPQKHPKKTPIWRRLRFT